MPRGSIVWLHDDRRMGVGVGVGRESGSVEGSWLWQASSHSGVSLYTPHLGSLTGPSSDDLSLDQSRPGCSFGISRGNGMPGRPPPWYTPTPLIHPHPLDTPPPPHTHTHRSPVTSGCYKDTWSKDPSVPDHWLVVHWFLTCVDLAGWLGGWSVGWWHRWLGNGWKRG